jgi:hypothetical protein
MSRPKGMSRKDYRNLKIIIRERLGDGISIDFSDGMASAARWERHEEGFSAKALNVYVGDKPGTYTVDDQSWGRDCDGRHSQSDAYTVGAAGKRKRWYWSRDWKANRPIGKFGVKARFKPLGEGDSRQRDYSAEAAGY